MKSVITWLCFVFASTGLCAGTSGPRSLEAYLKAYEYAWRHSQNRSQPQPPTREESQKMLPDLRKALTESQDADVRRMSALAAGLMYPTSAGCADVLMQALKDSDANVRATAAFALARFLPDAIVIVPALRATLSDGDGKVRERAAMSLGAFQRNSTAAIPDLEKMAREDAFSRARAAALDSIARIDPALASKRLPRDLKSSIEDMRFAAVVILNGPIGDRVAPDEVSSVVCDIVGDNLADLRLRQEALDVVFKRYRDRPEAIRALKAAIYANPSSVQGQPTEGEWYSGAYIEDGRPWMWHYQVDLGMSALVRIGDWGLDTEQVTAILQPGVEAGHPNRAALISQILQHGVIDDKVAESLVRILQAKPASTMQADYTKVVWEQELALRALGRSPLPKEQIARIAVRYVAVGRKEALAVLGECGPAAAQYLPQVEAYYGDPVCWVEAVKAAIKIGGPSPKIIHLINEMVGTDKDGEVIALLALCGQAGIENLIALTDDRNSFPVRRKALWALASTGEAGAIAVPRLIEMSHGQPSEEVEARECLVRLGSVAIPLLVVEIASRDDKRTLPALYVLARMGAPAEPCLPMVLQIWKDVVGRKRFGATSDLKGACERVLANLEGTEPALQSLIDSGDEPLVRAATSLLEKVKNQARGHYTFDQ